MRIRSLKIQRLVRAAIIAAVYVALCYAFGFLAYGPVQVRVSEALTLLPVICAEAVPGVAVGCLVANLISPGVHVLDVVFGTLATLLAALLTRALRRRRIKGLALPAALPPVFINAVVVGAVVWVLYLPGTPPWMLPVSMASVGAGQAVSCGILGVALVWAIERRPALLRMLGGDATARG